MVNRIRRGVAAILVLAATSAFGQFANAQGEFPTRGLTEIKVDSQVCTGWWRQASWKCEPIKVPAYMAVPSNPKGALVIVSHGSQGIDLHHRWYLNALAKRGFYAIGIDHFKPRNLRDLGRTGYVRTSVGAGGNALNMAIDTMAVATWARNNPTFKDFKIGHMGESMGASVARELNRPGMPNLLNEVLATQTQPLDAYVALYMGCFEKSSTDKFIGKPVLLINGTADDDTPVATCRTFTKWANDRGANMTLVEVPGAHHQFDSWYKLAYFGDIENQRNCASQVDVPAGVYVDDLTGKTYPYNGEGFAQYRRDCIIRGAHAGSVTQAEGVGFDLWIQFFAENLK